MDLVATYEQLTKTTHTHTHTYIYKGKGKVFPLQAWCGPEGG